MGANPRLYTLEEANNLVPDLNRLIPELRELRDRVMKEKDRHDVEEITSHGTSGEAAYIARAVMDEARAKIEEHEKEIEKRFKFFEDLRCEIKSIDPGLVDFFSERQGEIVYLCWREGEDAIRYWHPLSTGFAGRQPVEEDE